MSKRGSTQPASVTKKSKTEKTAADYVDWELMQSDVASRTINPIRGIIEGLTIPNSKDKPLIPLSIGDPTAFGNLHPPAHMHSSMIKVIQANKHNGYAPSTGLPATREAIATRYGCDAAPLTKDDVIVTSGCSGALVIAIQSILSTGDNLLVPAPGFCIYETAAGHSGSSVKYYNLQPQKKWEVDLKHVESLIDDRTKGILINNPSNPTGSNYSKEHLLDILELCERRKLPIIADEIYADMVFYGAESHRMARLTTTVPIIACGGLAKMYLVPGWRVGWMTFHDRNNQLAEVKKGANKLSQLILGACTVVQGGVPALLNQTEPSYYTKLVAQLEGQASILTEALCKNPCLEVIKPQGAMYVMARLKLEVMPDITDDLDFVQKLLNEEHVFVLPGKCFHAADFVRFVFCAPEKILREAAARIEAFCLRHKK